MDSVSSTFLVSTMGMNVDGRQDVGGMHEEDVHWHDLSVDGEVPGAPRI